MNDQTKEILIKLARRLDLVVTAVLLLLLCVVILFTLRERDYQPIVLDTPARRQWDVKLPMDAVVTTTPTATPVPGDEGKPVIEAEGWSRVRRLLLQANGDINKDEKARRVISVNMFDIKTVEEAGKEMEELNKRYNEAEKRFAEKNYTETLAIVNEILGKEPTHKNALDLKKRVETLLATPTPAPAATPTPAPAA